MYFFLFIYLKQSSLQLAGFSGSSRVANNEIGDCLQESKFPSQFYQRPTEIFSVRMYSQLSLSCLKQLYLSTLLKTAEKMRNKMEEKQNMKERNNPNKLLRTKKKKSQSCQEKQQEEVMIFFPFFHYLRNIHPFSQRETVLYFGVCNTTATLIHYIMTLLVIQYTDLLLAENSIVKKDLVNSKQGPSLMNITYVKHWVANFCNKVFHSPNTFKFSELFPP